MDVDQETKHPGQLELDALRFATGEMGIDEQSRFEDRLAAEPGVANALSQVLDLHSTVAALFESDSVATPTVQVTPATLARPRSSVTSLLPITVALTACLVIAVVIAPANSPQLPASSHEVASSDSANTNVVGQRQPSELIENWLQAASVTQFDRSREESGDEEVIELAMLEPAEAFSTDSEEVVPDWLFDAVQSGDMAEVGIE